MSDGAVFLMCGPSFSGKSTLARRLAQRWQCACVSLDDINAGRGLTAGFTLPREEWAKTHDLAVAELESLLRAGHSRVVVDDTNCFRFLRDNYRAVAQKYSRRCRILVMDVSEEALWGRIDGDEAGRRERGLERASYEAHLKSFEWPDADEDQITYRPSEDFERWVAPLDQVAGHTGSPRC